MASESWKPPRTSRRYVTSSSSSHLTGAFTQRCSVPWPVAANRSLWTSHLRCQPPTRRTWFTLAAETGTRVFASSAFRYADGIVNVLNSIQAAGERVKTCCVRYWLQIQETQGRYFWYGIHGAEMLRTIMGPGVREVEASCSADRDSITVWHDDGRQSSILGSRSDGTFRVTIETDKREIDVDLTSSMPSLSARVLWAALDVLTDGQFPKLWGATLAGSVSGPRPGRAFDPDGKETFEIVRLLDAAQRSYGSQQRVVV